MEKERIKKEITEGRKILVPVPGLHTAKVVDPLGVARILVEVDLGLVAGRDQGRTLDHEAEVIPDHHVEVILIEETTVAVVNQQDFSGATIVPNVVRLFLVEAIGGVVGVETTVPTPTEADSEIDLVIHHQGPDLDRAPDIQGQSPAVDHPVKIESMADVVDLL